MLFLRFQQSYKTKMLSEVTITSKHAGTTMYKSLLGDVLALKRAAVSTFRTVYSARLQERCCRMTLCCHGRRHVVLESLYNCYILIYCLYLGRTTIYLFMKIINFVEFVNTPPSLVLPLSYHMPHNICT